MSLKWANNASTTIAGSINATDTKVALAAGTGILFPQVKAGSGNYFCATFYDQATKTVYEIVHVTDITGDIATISATSPHVRGLPGTDDATTPRAWNAGDIFANLITAGTLDSFIQAGALPAAPTTELYIGIDISTVPNHIICPTQPVPASLQIGMQFNIKVANANTTVTDTLNYKAAVDLALNGNPAIPAKLTDGSDLNPIDLIAGLEYIFIYNGVNFTTCLQDAVLKPPQKTFYVRSDSTSTWADPPTNSLETATGLANTPTSAFKTLQGALNTITKRYVSTDGIILAVADGTYTSGIQHQNPYIGKVEVQGNDANPQNCVLDCRNSNPNSYVPGSSAGNCVFVGGGAGNIDVHGFRFLSYDQNVAVVGGTCWVHECQLTGPVSGIIGALTVGGNNSWMNVTGNITIEGSAQGWFYSQNGYLILGSYYIGYPQFNKPINIHAKGQVSVSYGVLLAFFNGIVDVANFTAGLVNITQDAQIIGPEWWIASGGGIGYGGPIGVFNCSQPGVNADGTGWVT